MNSWSYVSEFYEQLAKNEEWKEFAFIEKFVKHLIANRNLDEIYAHTSHEILCVTKSEEYDRYIKEPNIFIELNYGASEDYIYKFSFVETLKNNDLIRMKQENILCSFEKSLEIFDEMVKKLKVISK